ncbi:MAG: hypothetical protein EA412_07885 [Chitinophagaceae bacterium]|nr:MAG: hypothetical protein EA412_07885 [Chitinophagaceae bacterium]
MKTFFLVLILLFTFCSKKDTFAQASFDRQVVDIGNIGLSITNVGTMGRPDVRNNPQGGPSMEYPIGSGVEHLFEAGLWIGALVEGQVAVSTASVDNPVGYTTGGSGFEFTGLGPIQKRSSLSNSENFSLDAVSHQDMLVSFTDEFTTVGNIPISEHTLPLNARVELETYAWNFSYADYFVIFNYHIINESNVAWDSVYIGIWSDLIVRNINVATDAGAAFFNKGGGGFIDSFFSIYAFDVEGDPGLTNSYGATQFLGMYWNDYFYHPSNQQPFIDDGLPAPEIKGNFWNFRAFDGTQLGAPANDVERYEKMRQGLDFSDQGLVELLQSPGNRTQLLSAGPLVRVEPGDTVNFVTSFVAARQLDTGGTTGPDKDTEFARTRLIENLGWARRTYNGEDVNENGVLDPGEDINDNGVLDRFILPEPPATPIVHVVPGSQKVTFYWDQEAEFSIDPLSKKMDFEGYRVYRSNIGDDFGVDLLGESKLIAQWDKPGNDVGFNNGFSSIRMDQPKYFEGDTTAYWYKFEVDGLLNGWQYMFIITSFDEGDDELGLPPLESSFVENSFRVTPGTKPNEDFPKREVGVYPNPYRTNAAWDGSSSRTKKLYFYNLPALCEIKIYTLSGDVIAVLNHEGDDYDGSGLGWYNNFGGQRSNRHFSGGEHAWDLLTDSRQSISQGIYLYSVRDRESGEIFRGKFTILN